MRFKTDVTLPIGKIEISHSTKIMLLGSCFAQNMGMRLKEYKFDVDVNPFGILYNPFSLSVALQRIIDCELIMPSSSCMIQHNGLWHSLMHHGDFSSENADEVVASVNKRIESAHDMLPSLDLLMLTFGTAYVYRNINDGKVVGNCHKLPQKMFSRELLSVEEIVNEISGLIEKLKEVSRSARIMFTISPIRHLRDGAHDNQVSKATLLLAVEELKRNFPEQVLYFPSYEIMLDELRDYRFYADDMVHPSSLAQDYIWECFASSFFSQRTAGLNIEIGEITKALAHRPNNPSSPEYKAFINKILMKVKSLVESNPFMDFKNEIERCNTLLNI
ncbi:MAG: GSCFA domain-containing protein [Bacteroidaceae bacterium]|nr:GSCFA domain-containing protein [Bacteroidaceae bacterium]